MTRPKHAQPGRKFTYLMAIAVVVGSLCSCSSPESGTGTAADSQTQDGGGGPTQAQLTSLIRDQLFEPDSYEQVEINRQVAGDMVTIVTRFKFSNSDGEIEVNEVTATASASGAGNDLKVLTWKRVAITPDQS